MRQQLASEDGIRKRFFGTFLKFGTKHGYKHIETTVLLINICDENHQLLYDSEKQPEHLWFNFTKAFETLYTKEILKIGTIIQFTARVKPYYKGYEKDNLDFKLSHPTQFIVKGFDSQYQGQSLSPPYEFERRQKLAEYWNKKNRQKLKTEPENILKVNAEGKIGSVKNTQIKSLFDYFNEEE